MPTQRVRLAGNSPVKRTSVPASKKSKTVRLARTPTYKPRDLGVPTQDQFDEVVEDYLQSLSIRKREKALISQDMFDDIWDSLQHPTNAKIRTPQFRFWVRKMFTLSAGGPQSHDLPSIADDADVVPVVLHEGRPVAVKEQLYDILSYYHLCTGHGGRDKTMAEIKENYSWVPKELVARYLKTCPTCTCKRSGGLSKSAAMGAFPTFKPDSHAPRELRPSPSSDYDGETISTSYSQAVSLTSSEEAWVPSLLPNPLPAMASLLESRILPIPVLSPVLRSPTLGSPHLSPNLSADPRKWLADLTMQPGPSAVGSSHRFPPLALRRAGSDGGGDPARRRVALPPLMKALSEGMADPEMHRPGFNVPEGLKIPERSALGNILDADVDMLDTLIGWEYGDSMAGGYPGIDPALINATYPVVNTYDGYQQQKASSSSYFSGPAAVSPVVLPRNELFSMDYRAPSLQRSGSEDSVSSARSFKSSTSQVSAASVYSVMSQGQSSEVEVMGGSAKASEDMGGMLHESLSFDPQDWESSYCLDEV